ncbi:hypothetical protein TWF225_003750 [Orbilia oligospora]|uniref:Uncharacterized protein n=1 Tax=Orbilia oligospora TaxID=2813651 RepID=A0A7C8KLE0_ORBOL|nr:hypothetical protein TWF751_003498 [Orbilia oligospora]KAF3195359.1 hypothetical protein TWF225_003750 [Orbilia oligospora]KAF3254217.1 hypothetical protein TWF217_007182 [Orbilia oligospora]KAF3267676.1 hypothetical protein TWF128_009184 [Orbilia oligospora]KAF3298173.1 hypothetical protein TWF132_000013 [Orbilia oligospora]
MSDDFEETWRGLYAPVIRYWGQYIRLYAQKNDSSIVEGYWDRSGRKWTFKEVVPAGIAGLPTAGLAATMVEQGETHLFFVDNEGQIREIGIHGNYGDKPKPGPLDKLKLKTSLPISVLPLNQHRAANEMALYYRDSSNILREYKWNSCGHEKWELTHSFKWTDFGPLTTDVKFVNMSKWMSTANELSIRGFYQNSDGYLVELRYDDGFWGTGFLHQKVPITDPPSSVAFTPIANDLYTAPKLAVFYMQDNKVYQMRKEGRDGYWYGPYEQTTEEEVEKGNIAGVGALTEHQDQHLFISEKGNKFVHRYQILGGSWTKEVVDFND